MDIDVLLKNLKSREFEARYFDRKEDAADYLVEQIHDTTVGIGGSLTIDQLNIYDRLCKNNTVYWHWKEKNDIIYKKEMEADVFLTGANAMSVAGEIVLIDARGNRLASVAYPSDKIIYIVMSLNKVCDDLLSAINRAKNIAATKNMKRLRAEAGTPCLIDGKCHDCKSPECLIRGMFVLMQKTIGCQKCEVILIGEPLGM